MQIALYVIQLLKAKLWSILDEEEEEKCDLCATVTTTFYILYACHHHICTLCLYSSVHKQLSASVRDVACPVCNQMIVHYFLPITNEKFFKELHEYIYYNTPD